MEHLSSCPICGCPDSTPAHTCTDHTVTGARFTIQQCLGCGLYFTNPRPAGNKIGDYYLSENYISHAAKARTLRDHLYHWVRRRAIKGKHNLIRSHVEHGRLLDIGCGTGSFLAYMKEVGYDVQGVEVSTAARQVAQEKQITVVEELGKIPETDRFDVITLWHVLEHVPDPLQTMKEVFLRCAPGGLLVVAVPDRSSWDSSHYGADWAAWDVPRHLFHFRGQDVQRLFKTTGFTPLETRKMWFDAPYVAMLSEQHRGAGPIASLVKGAAIGLWSNGVAWANGRPTSSSLYLAQKTK